MRIFLKIIFSFLPFFFFSLYADKLNSNPGLESSWLKIENRLSYPITQVVYSQSGLNKYSENLLTDPSIQPSSIYRFIIPTGILTIRVSFKIKDHFITFEQTANFKAGQLYEWIIEKRPEEFALELLPDFQEDYYDNYDEYYEDEYYEDEYYDEGY